MKKLLIISIGLFIALVAVIVTPEVVEAGECLTGPVYLRDYQVTMKGPLYLRSVPCTDGSYQSDVVGSVKNGEKVTVIAENHGWAKIKKEDGTIGWAWGPGWFKEVLTQDRFSDNTYVSSMGYGIDDTHQEFNFLFSSPDTVEQEEKTYNLSSSIKSQLDSIIQRVIAVVEEKISDKTGQKSMYESIVRSLRKVQAEKENIAEMLEYVIDKLLAHKNMI